jgi:hypothetical protein
MLTSCCSALHCAILKSSNFPRLLANTHAALPRTLPLPPDPFEGCFRIGSAGRCRRTRKSVAASHWPIMRASRSESCVSVVVCNVDASEAIDAARQLGADAAVPGGRGNVADAGYGPGNHAAARTSAGCSRNASVANAGAGGPRAATSSERCATANHAGCSRHDDRSHNHGDGAAQAAATNPATNPARATRDPGPAGTCGYGADPSATQGIDSGCCAFICVHPGRRDPIAGPDIRSSARQYLRAGWHGAHHLEPRGH